MYSHKCLPLQVIIYVDDANDEVPVFTQQQYNRLGLRETAGIGTSVIVVRATDPDTGESSLRSIQRREQREWRLMSVVVVDPSVSGFIFIAVNIPLLLCQHWHESIVCRSPALTLVGATPKGNIKPLNQNFLPC